MKLKKLFSVSLAAVMALSLTACGSNTYEKQLKKDMKTYASYITLGEYKNIEVEVDKSQLTVTDEDIQKKMDSLRSNFATEEKITEGVTKKGDAIILDYSGKIDGTAFSGGTATDASYTIGSGEFISDLDAGLAGLTLGQEYDITTVFPDDYRNEEFRNKTAIFTVTVKSIVNKILPEYNEELVKKIAEAQSWEVSTVAQLEAKVKETLEAEKKNSYDEQKFKDVWNTILDNCTVSGYEENELNQLKTNIHNNVKTEYEQYGSYYNITSFEGWISSMYGFKDQEEFNQYAEEYAKSYMDEKMAVTLIAEREGITVTQDEIKELGNEMAAQYSYDSYDALYKEFGDDIVMELGYSVLSNKIIDLVMNNAVEKEVSKS